MILIRAKEYLTISVMERKCSGWKTMYLWSTTCLCMQDGMWLSEWQCHCCPVCLLSHLFCQGHTHRAFDTNCSIATCGNLSHSKKHQNRSRHCSLAWNACAQFLLPWGSWPKHCWPTSTLSCAESYHTERGTVSMVENLLSLCWGVWSSFLIRLSTQRLIMLWKMLRGEVYMTPKLPELKKSLENALRQHCANLGAVLHL